MLKTPLTPKVLLVETNRTLRRLLAVYLTNHGYTVSTASTADKASTLLGDEDFDVLITEMDLPDLPGQELLSVVKTTFRDLKVMILRGQHTPHEYLLLRGALETLCKPFHNKELALKLDVVIKERRRAVRFKTKDIFCKIRTPEGPEPLQGILNNISFDGAAIDTESEVPGKGDITVEFFLPDSGKSLGQLKGKIMRVQDRQEKLFCQLGVYFNKDGQIDLLDHLEPYIEKII